MNICCASLKIRLKRIDQCQELFFLADGKRNLVLVLHYDRVAAIGFDEVVEIKHVDQVRLVRPEKMERLEQRLVFL